MTARAFIDTNVAVYLYDSAEPDKQATARAVIADEELDLVISSQVLGEFYVTVTRKLATPLDAPSAREAVDALARLPVVPTDRDLVAKAIGTSIRHQLSYWDALILEAAVTGNCSLLLTEDLSSGSTLRGVEVSNPFAT